MTLRRSLSAIVVLLLTTAPALAQTRALGLVHPLVGTSSSGQTYPAVGVPFAMTSWTPQTRAGEVKCVAPYYFSDAKIQGFRGSHFMSGSCVPDYGSVTLMPIAGTLVTLPVERASTFDRSTEKATPYSYSVRLKDPDILAEISGVSRAGIMRFTYGKASAARIVIENNARGGDGWVNVDAAAQEVTGEVPVRREYAGSGKLAGFSTFFVIEFSQHFTTSGTWVGSQVNDGPATQKGDGMEPGVKHFADASHAASGPSVDHTVHTDSPRPGFGAYVSFGDGGAGKVIVARVGTSFVSLAEARKNLRAEIPGFDFDRVKLSTMHAWESALAEISVPVTSPAAPVFYTSMYHAMLQPRTYSDVSGAYPRFAAEHNTEHAEGFTYYDDFSMWDIFRAQLPLLTILEPQRSTDFVRSLIAKGKQGGYLPIYPAWNSYTSEMVGDHAAVAIMDAYAKGLRDFDVTGAYGLIRQNATQVPADKAELYDGKGRRGLASYLKYGYIPLEDHVPEAFKPHNDEQVSRTLEYAYDDAVIARFAASLGKTSDAEIFAERGENWRKVLDPQTRFARGRLADGTWVTPFDPAGKYTWITEGLPWQYTFFVPQDVPALVDFEGGPKAFETRLDQLFAGNYYDHGNEPSHHIAYLYDAANAPWKTQRQVRSLLESQYHDAPDGLAGNDDAGQMSAWYILSALGFYQLAPGIPEYWTGSPRFDLATVKLPGGRTLRIEAPGAESGSVYVRRILLNGRPIHGYKIPHSNLVSGGTLHFEMSKTPLQ